MKAARRVVMGALLSVLLFPAAALAAHPNDAYTSAKSIALSDEDPLSNAGATPTGVEASTEPLTPGGVGACDDGQYNTGSGIVMTHTIWWRVTGNGYPITIDTRGSAIDTVVAVYDGAPAEATFVACNDDIRGGASPDTDSEVFFNSDFGTTYYIQVGCAYVCGTPSGGIIDFIAFKSPPGDFKDEALELKTGAGTSGEVRGATEEAGETLDCNGVPFSRTVWLRYRAPGPGTATFAAGGTFDTVVSVYRGAGRVGCDDDPSQVRTHVTAGDYLIQVGIVGISPNTGYGDFRATVGFTGDPPPPPSDRDGDGVVDSADHCPDQNASARDANRDGCLDPDPDPDHDGVFGAADHCPTQNAAGRDANRDGCLDKVPLKELKGARASLRATPTNTGIRVRSLRVTAPRGAKVLVRCGRRCKFAKTALFSEAPVATAARLVTFKRLAGRSFSAGARIKIYVSKKNRIGKYFEYRVTKGNFRKIERCLAPGTRRVRKCP
jgi:hypothetical protein